MEKTALKKFKKFEINWLVIDTNPSISEYSSSVIRKGIRQNTDLDKYGRLSLSFSYMYASNLYKGNNNDIIDAAYRWIHAREFVDYFSDDVKELTKKINDELKLGKPVIVQVSKNNESETRHFVVIVGINERIKTNSIIKEDGFLCIDVFDGLIKKMGKQSLIYFSNGDMTNHIYKSYYLKLLK